LRISYNEYFSGSFGHYLGRYPTPIYSAHFFILGNKMKKAELIKEILRILRLPTQNNRDYFTEEELQEILNALKNKN
jgi:hypothetical protein